MKQYTAKELSLKTGISQRTILRLAKERIIGTETRIVLKKGCPIKWIFTDADIRIIDAFGLRRKAGRPSYALQKKILDKQREKK